MFQSTRPRGARLKGSMSIHTGEACFNPRARAGRDWHIQGCACDIACFNPRARAGRDAIQD